MSEKSLPSASSLSPAPDLTGKAMQEQFETFNLDISGDSDSEHDAQSLAVLHTPKILENNQMTSQQPISLTQFVRSSSSRAADVWTFIEKNEITNINTCRFCMQVYFFFYQLILLIYYLVMHRVLIQQLGFIPSNQTLVSQIFEIIFVTCI
jgi:hypothetical protein